MARLRLSRLSVARTGAARRFFCVGGSTLTVLAEPEFLLVRISRRDWWPDQHTSDELVIITDFQENGEALHRAGMSFVCPSAEIFFPKPVSSWSNLLPCKGEWFWEFRGQETGR